MLASSALVAAPSADGASETVVSLTFDDGQASQYAAASVLHRHGMAGTFYINSGYVGSSGCAGSQPDWYMGLVPEPQIWNCAIHMCYN
jgi:peptidoglycan/xylan/chitin deacetylase (PgdA/CDA1 family)